MSSVVQSFDWIVNEKSKVLVLGTLPSVESLIKNEYYGNPRNAFWRIIDAIFGCNYERAAYELKKNNLLSKRIALWDVLRQGRREGSRDSSITGVVANDHNLFFSEYPAITHVMFNGTKSYQFFERLVLNDLNDRSRLELHLLPSTSPLYARPFNEKLEKWRIIRECLAQG